MPFFAPRSAALKASGPLAAGDRCRDTPRTPRAPRPRRAASTSRRTSSGERNRPSQRINVDRDRGTLDLFSGGARVERALGWSGRLGTSGFAPAPLRAASSGRDRLPCSTRRWTTPTLRMSSTKHLSTAPTRALKKLHRSLCRELNAPRASVQSIQRAELGVLRSSERLAAASELLLSENHAAVPP
jgi:hypothetical protein